MWGSYKESEKLALVGKRPTVKNFWIISCCHESRLLMYFFNLIYI